MKSLMKKLFFIAALVCGALPAAADSSLDSNVMPASGIDSNVMPSSGYDSNVMPKGGIDSNRMPSDAKTPKVDPALCQALVKHTPSADTAYQPGVDANGNPVAPADLPGAPQMKLPDKIDIPLTLSLAKVLNLNTSQYPYNQLGTGTEAWIGTLTVEGDSVLFNGKPLSDEQQNNLAVLCMKPNQ
jgi:hypothetical protein